MLWWWAGLTFGDSFDKAADIFPENEALVDREHRLTHAKLRKKANKLAIGRMDLDRLRVRGRIARFASPMPGNTPLRNSAPIDTLAVT